MHWFSWFEVRVCYERVVWIVHHFLFSLNTFARVQFYREKISVSHILAKPHFLFTAKHIAFTALKQFNASNKSTAAK